MKGKVMQFCHLRAADLGGNTIAELGHRNCCALQISKGSTIPTFSLFVYVAMIQTRLFKWSLLKLSS
jgi:hypothetical protein